MLTFIYTVKVEIEVPERIDSLEKTPEGMTLLEAIEAKLVYDSSDEDDDDDEFEDVEGAAIQKGSLKICNKPKRQINATKEIARELLLSAGEEIRKEKDG